MANVALTPGTGVFVATNSVSRDGVTENMEIVNLGDSSTATSVSVSAAGTPGSNALTIQGNASGVPVPVQSGASSSTISQLGSATSAAPLYVKAAPGLVSKLINTSTSSLAGSTITIIDQSTGAANTANIIYQCVGMAAGQVIDLAIPTATGIGIYLSGTALSSNIVLTWR